MIPKVSVIVPIYNVAQYIERCARSLFEQTFDDIEYVFVNDCTPDDSIEILRDVLEQYPHRKPQARIVDKPSNSGLAAVRRFGSQLATGEYIIHCDSDDWVHPSMYEKLYNFAISGDYDMVWCDYYRSDAQNHTHITQKTSTDVESVIRGFLGSRLIGSVWNRLYKSRLQKNDSFVYPKADMTEDFVMSVQITLNSKRIGYLPEPLYYYFYNPTSICLNPNEGKIKKNLDGVIQNTELVISCLKKAEFYSRMPLEIESKKFFCKEILIPLLHKKEYRELWRNTYSEVNNNIRNNPFIPSNSKFRAFCLLHNMYCVYAWSRGLSHFVDRIKRIC